MGTLADFDIRLPPFELGADAGDFPGIISFCPGRRLAFGDRLLAAVSCATVVLFRRAIVHRLSPALTTYVDAGVTSATGSVMSAPATGVPGRVGVKRTPLSAITGAAAGVSGLKEIADEVDAGSFEALGAFEFELGAERIGDVVVDAVSLGEGDGFVVLQPGFAKIRISAKRWMPTTMPKIFRIFIG